MVFKSKLPFVCLLVLALFLISVSGSTDPELKQCKHQCRAQQQTDERKIRECLQSCEDYHSEKQERERERHEGGRGGGGGSGDVFNPESPKERLRVCEKRCEQGQKGQQEQQSCRRQCQQTYERERQEGGGGNSDIDPEEHLRVCQKQCYQGQKGQEEKQQCRQKCRQQYEREKEQERQEGGHGGGDRDVLFKPDPEEHLRVCQQQCYQGQQGQEEKQQCRQKCRQEYEREKERERKEGGRGSGGGSTEDKQDPQKEYKQCQKKCQRESEGRYSQERCMSRCEERRQESEQHQGGQGGEYNDHHHGGRQSEEEEEEQGEQEENPYVFEDQHFSTPIKTQHGRVRVLQKFTDRSKLLRGIENYRITILEAEPQTFIVPNHWDAEIVAFVANGRGTLSLVRSQRRESFSIKRGDIVRIPAGTTTYLINQDNNERLVLAKLLQPVSTPGDIESFFGAGGENPESFYRAFSNEILEAAFNAKSDRIQSIFGQQKQGAILKASQEQIRALSHHEEGGIWPFGGESKGTINMFQQRPSQENQYGQLYEVAPEDHRQLEDLEVAVSYMNLTQGAMSGPMYMSKATKIAIVVRGEGYFEMACPHMASQSGSRQGREGGRQGREGGRRGSEVRYQKVSTPLRKGTVVVIPAGHPFATVASNNQNLEMLCFEVNARNSQRFALAGQRNVVNQFEREAKELAFGVPAREVEEVFNSQEQEYFFKGPRQQHQGRADA